MVIKNFLYNLVFIAPFLEILLFNLIIVEAETKIMEPLENWPTYNKFGQISGVAIDKNNNVLVFHRGDREWNSLTFHSNIFVERDKGPISHHTVIVLDPDTGILIKKAGKNFFYLPHGLTVDFENNVWLTDVAMHQVFKFPPLKLSENETSNWRPEITLGMFLEPGSDDFHFCKPTSVAVDSTTKEFYVSDGYCNGRIIKYSSTGKKLLQWGKMSTGLSSEISTYMLSVPHSLALAQGKNTLYVADRENYRILSYDPEFGKFKKVLTSEKKNKIYSVAYFSFNVLGEFLFGLANNGVKANAVSIYNSETGTHLLDVFLKHKLTNPHDLAISPDGKYCYIVELSPPKIWKIKLDLSIISNKLNESHNEATKELVHPESTISKSEDYNLSSSYIAVALVISVVVFSFLFFIIHFYKRKGTYRNYEGRRLLLDDDQGGLQLT